MLIIICNTMSDDDDDYLSEKFLNASTSTAAKPTTYSQIRKEAKKKSQQKNEQNRHKSRRQLELESREEGLSKSLFERAKEEEDSGLVGSSNKALSIMRKMGFKPGQSLGNSGHDQSDRDLSRGPSNGVESTKDASAAHPTIANPKHKTEPLPIQEWAGRKGIGLGKRAHSPSPAERLAKMAKMAEDMGQRDFRDRARDEYNNRRAEGRLVPAQLTCRTLDEQMGKSFNVLLLSPNNHDTFPAGLIKALSLNSNLPVVSERHGDPIQNRLKQQMRADALQPLHDDPLGEPGPVMKSPEDQFSPEVLEEATQFLRLQAQDRLHLVLSYLRHKHAYCFWCGVKYEDEEDMQNQCPGTEEDDHD